MSKAEITELTLVRRANILQLMQDGDWTRQQFAKKTGVKIGTLGSVLGPKPTANIGTKITNQVEGKLKKPIGWLDKDRRKEKEGKSPQSSRPSNCAGTLSMEADGFVVTDKQITKHQALEIMRVLIED